MKILNNFFILVYSLALIMSVWLSINWLVEQGAFFSTQKFISLTPFILALFLALLFSIFLHFKLRTRTSAPIHKIFIGVTLLNFILFIWLIYGIIVNNGCAGCTALIFPVFIIMILWSISLVSGTIALRKTATN